MNPHTQSRKWTLVINNPLECGLDHEKIAELLMKCNPVYFCMSDEIATTGTFHTHIFLYAHSPVRFGTIKGRFPTAHIEKANGSAVQNRDYIAKSGKWAEDEKAKTTVEGSFFEYGDLPEEHSKASSKMSRLLEEIKEGKRTAEIVNDSPGFGFRTREIESLRQTILSDEYTVKYR